MADVGTLTTSLAPEHRRRHGVRQVLGEAAWLRLPEAVRARFAESAPDVTYAGAFEIVRASLLGRGFAWLGTLFGTPVVPRIGENVEMRVHVRKNRDGVVWAREYRWDGGGTHVVTSIKVVTDEGLLERLPARLCMPLDVTEEHGALVFTSRGYYFDFSRSSPGDSSRGGPGLRLRLPLPAFFSPGVTRVEHIELGNGWFRFTMIVTHAWFGELFFQTGRFCATEETP